MAAARSALLLTTFGGVKLECKNDVELVDGSQEFIIASSKCYLCDHAFVEGDQPFLIFEQRLRDDGQPECALSTVLTSALGRDVLEAEAHSSLLCERCNGTVLEFEQLEQRFCEIRYRILSAYNRTARFNALEPILFEVNGVLQDVVGKDTEEEENYDIDVSAKEETVEDVVLTDLDTDALVEEVQEDDALSVVVVESMDGEDQTASVVTKTGSVYTEQQDSQDGVESYVDDSDIIYNDIIEEQLSQESGDVSDEGYTEQQNIETDIATASISDQTTENGSEAPDPFDHSALYKLEGNRYCCLICKTNPPHLGVKSFAEHMRSAHNTILHMCELCGSGFPVRQDLEAHMSLQHCSAANKHKCELCGRVFANYRVFRLHQRSHSGANKPYECSECHKKYVCKNLLVEHWNMHTGARPYKCTQCPKDFASKFTLQAHLKIHTERQRPFKCDECDKAFLYAQNLVQHKKLHVNVKAFVCAVCQKAFSTQHNLDVHKIVHSGQRPFLCRTCGKSFVRPADVKDHERTHTGERPFKCDLCPLAFAQRSNLTSHKKSTHFNEKLHQCSECGRSFKRKRLLDYHIQAAHTGERPHKCEVCGAAFVYPEHYKKHMIIHSGQKPYACEICGKQFSSADNRKAHRFVHSDKKPYECLDCGTGFMRKPLLLAHIKRMQHSNHTIIVNQPRINKQRPGDSTLVKTDETYFIEENVGGNVDDPEEANIIVEESASRSSLDDMMQNAKSITQPEEGEGDNVDAITTVSGQLIKDELGNVKYLEFPDLEGQGEFTWVDMAGDEDKV